MSPDDSLVANVMARHGEFAVVWEISPSVLTEEFEVNGVSPYAHLAGDVAVEAILKDDYWPPKELLALARAISAGRGRAKSLGGANLVLLLGEGKYARADELKRLAQDHPLVHMENVAAVAEELDRRGQMFFCVKALEHNVEFALGLGEEELVRKAASAVAEARHRHLANQR